MRGTRNLTTVLGALLALIGTIFVLRPATADPGNLPAPLGQATNSGTGSLGCPNGAKWKGFDANGTTEQVGPVAVFIESGGRVWVSDFRNSDLDQAHSTAGKVFSWPSIAQAADCNQPDREIDGINQPEGIVVDSSGNVFVADTGDSHIFKFSAARAAGFTTIGTGAANVRDNTGSPTLDINTSNGNGSAFTRGLAIGPDGNLWAADDGNNRLIALDVLGTHTNTAPVKTITQGACHPKAVAFVGSALFAVNYPQGNCTGQVVRYNAANNAQAPSATFAFDHPIDMTAVGTTTLAVTSTSGGYALIANAPTAATNATAPALNKTATENGQTGSYAFGVNTFGISTQAANGNPTLVADSSNFRVLNVDLTPVAQKTNTATAVTSSKNPSNQGDQVTFTATVTPASGTTVPTGTVQFKDGTTNLGTAQTLDNTGKATLQTNALAAGSHAITAVYSGNANFNGSTSAALTQTVNAPSKVTTTTAVTSSKNPSTSGQAVTFTATVTPASGTAVPTGSVQFTSDGTNVGGPVAVDQTGHAAVATDALAVGNHVIAANYSGDANFNASSGTLANGQTVNAPVTPAATPTVSVDPSTVAAGSQVTVSGEHWGAGQLLQLTLQSTPVNLGTVTSDANGHFSVVVTIPATTTAEVHQIVVTSGAQQAAAYLQVTNGSDVTPTTVPKGILKVTGAATGQLSVVGTALLGLGAFILVGLGRRREPWSVD